MIALSRVEIDALAGPGWFARDGFLGRAPALALRGFARSLLARGALHESALGRTGDHDPSMRGDLTHFVNEGLRRRALGPLTRALDGLALSLGRDAWLPVGERQIQLACFPGGGTRYAKHRDAFRAGPGRARRVTAIFYLNDAWLPADGGPLRLHLDEGKRDIAPELDRVVVFLSARVQHEVMPVFRERLALTSWFYEP